MGDWFWPVFLVVFVLCWCLGALNRLRRLRRQALASVQKLFAQLAEFRPLFERRLQDAAPALPQWLDLLAAARQLDVALQAASHTSLDDAAIRSTSQAMEGLQRCWVAVSDAPQDLAGEVLPPELRTQWGVLSHRMLAARAHANQHVAAYNKAIAQIPVRWLASVVPFAAVAYF